MKLFGAFWGSTSMTDKLAVHVENGQRVTFKPETTREQAIFSPEVTLTAFFRLCLQDGFARTLLYAEAPTFYTWTRGGKWQNRKRGKSVEGQSGLSACDVIGIVYTVHPNNQQCLYLSCFYMKSVVHAPLKT
jgi:hypothetical protein